MDLLKKRLILSTAAAILLHAAVFIGIDRFYTPTAAGPSASPVPMAVHLDEIPSDIRPQEETASGPPSGEALQSAGDTITTGETVSPYPATSASGAQDDYRPGRVSPVKLEKISAGDRADHAPPHRTDPVPRGALEPEYPLSARMKGYEGITVIEIRVSATGRVVQTVIAESSGYDILDKAAVDSVLRTAFIPGMINDDPAEMDVRVKVVFTLQ